MIQDILPHKFSVEFSKKEIQSNDVVLLFQDNKILCKFVEDRLVFPTLMDIQKLVSKEKSDYQKKLNKWRSMIVINFESDPINCPICNNTMIYYNSIYT